MSARRAYPHPMVFLIASGILYSLAYTLHSQLPGPDITTHLIGTFQAYGPYKPRFLIAWIVTHLVGLFTDDWYADSIAFRFWYTLFLWIPTMMLLKRASERFELDEFAVKFFYPAIILIMLAQYCLPNVYSPYFVYDMPALTFYAIAFLTLTTPSLTNVIIGCCLVLIFSLNRETIIVVLFHAAAWHLRNETNGHRPFHRKTPVVILGVTVVALLFVKQILVFVLHMNQSELTGAFYEGNQIRLVANVSRIFVDWGSRQQLVAIGFGAVLYLPFAFFKCSRTIKYMIVASAFPMIPLLAVGNLLEIRIFTEFVPLLAAVLSVTIAGNAVEYGSEAVGTGESLWRAREAHGSESKDFAVSGGV